MAMKFPAIFLSRKAGIAKEAQAGSDDERKLVALCTCPSDEALQKLSTTLKGLSFSDADKRLSEYGPNELSKLKTLSFGADMFERLKSPLVIQLLVIATVSAIIGEFRSSIIVAAMILLSVGLSYILDKRSDREVEVLGKRVQSSIFVIREGKETELRMSEVVPGDIVLLHAGSIVPAIWEHDRQDFFSAKISLTGESMPVEKTAIELKERRFRPPSPGTRERLL